MLERFPPWVQSLWLAERALRRAARRAVLARGAEARSELQAAKSHFNDALGGTGPSDPPPRRLAD